MIYDSCFFITFQGFSLSFSAYCKVSDNPNVHKPVHPGLYRFMHIADAADDILQLFPTLQDVYTLRKSDILRCTCGIYNQSSLVLTRLILGRESFLKVILYFLLIDLLFNSNYNNMTTIMERRPK